MTKIGAALLIVLILSSCSPEEVVAVGKNFDGKKVWIFFQFNVPLEGGKIDTYYYYGLVSKSLYYDISKNKIERGFIFLDQVKYWKDDKIYNFRDEESNGSLVFRIEDIRKMELLNGNPMKLANNSKSKEEKAEEVEIKEVTED